MKNNLLVASQNAAANAAAIAAAAVVAVDIRYIKDELVEIKNKLDEQYVTQTEFKPVKQVVYGMISFILVAVMGALIALVVIR